MNPVRPPYAVIFVQTLRAPFQDPGGVRKLLVGGLLSIPPILNFVAWGYVYRVFIAGLNGRQEFVMPDWGEWRRYFGVGGWLFVIMAGYVIMLSVAVLAAASASGASLENPTHVMMAALVAIGVFHGFSSVVFARFAAEGRVWAAFEPDAIWRDLRRVVRTDYVQLLTAAYGVWLMVQLIFAPIPYLIGLGIASVFQFYLMVVMAHVMGLLVGERLAAAEQGTEAFEDEADEDDEEDDEGEDPPPPRW